MTAEKYQDLKYQALLDTLKGINNNIKSTNDLLALMDRVNIKLINVTGQPVTIVDESGNVKTYEPKTALSTQFKINGCCFLLTEETFQALQSIIPLFKIAGPTPFLLVALPKEPYYEITNNPFTPNKLIGYKRIELHNIACKK